MRACVVAIILAVGAAMFSETPQRGLYPEDAYNLEISQFLVPKTQRNPQDPTQRKPPDPLQMHCISDMPGSFLLSTSMMVAGVCITCAAVMYLVHMASRTNDDTTNQIVVENPRLQNQVAARPKKPNLDALDGMRTLLVTYVIVMHYPKNLPFGLDKFIVMGWPMQFFFVLSGFILYYVCEDKHRTFDFTSGAKLVTRRLVRLVPLYQVAMLVEFMWSVASHLRAPGKPFIAWPIHALFLQTLLPLKVCGEMQQGKEWALNYLHFAQNGIGWFTAALVWMSCLFPFLYNLQKKFNHGQTVAILFWLLVCRSIPEILHPTWGHWGKGNMHLFVFLPLRLLEFHAGMLAAQVVRDLPLESGIRTMRGWGWVFDGLLLTGLTVVHWPVVVNHEHGTYGVYYTGDFFITGLWCLVCVACRLATEQGVSHFASGPFFWLLSSWPLCALAQYSFAAYILQSIVLTGWDPGFPWNVCIVWAIGFVASKVIEKPLRKMVDLKLRGGACTGK